MRKLYFLSFIIFLFAFNLRAQVNAGYWYEDFESMTINAPPSLGWSAVGGFSVLGSPHGVVSGIKINGLSKRLNTNTGLGNVDSVISPKLTLFGCNVHIGWFAYRICDWVGGIPVSATSLNPGDTCYISVYKYSGTSIISKTIINKIHQGNHTQVGTNWNNVTSFNQLPNWSPAVFGIFDTISIGIKVKRGAVGDYWYDFDDFIVVLPVSVKEQNNFSSYEIYPNPTKNNLTLRLNAGETFNSVSIKNNFGQEVLFDSPSANDNSSQKNLDINSLSQGLYFIEITTQKGEKTVKKFVKD